MFPVWITGNLTRDPEIRAINSGTMVAKFSVATSKRVKDKSTGEYGPGPGSFWDCVAWGEVAEQIAEELRKGQGVILHGELEQRSYTANDGTEKKVTEVTVRNIGLDLSRVKRSTQARQERSSFDESAIPF